MQDKKLSNLLLLTQQQILLLGTRLVLFPTQLQVLLQVLLLPCFLNGNVVFIGWIQRGVLMPVLKACLSLSGALDKEAKFLLGSQALQSMVYDNNNIVVG